MFEVFISYLRPTAAKARLFAEALAREGYQVWWDDTLPAHRSFSDVINERLGQAKAVMVIWSKAAAQSDWVRDEADFARSHDKLVQASADAAKVATHLAKT